MTALVSRGFLTCKVGTAVRTSCRQRSARECVCSAHHGTTETRPPPCFLTMGTWVAPTAPAMAEGAHLGQESTELRIGSCVSVPALPPRDPGKSPPPWAFWKLASHH